MNREARLKELEGYWGENFADAIDTALEIFDGEGDQELRVKEFFLAVLFDMPLPRAGAADDLIKFLQGSLGR